MLRWSFAVPKATFQCGRISVVIFYALSCPQRLLRLFQTREKSLDFYNCKLLPQGVPGSNPGSVKHFFHYFYHFLPENAFWYAKTAVLYENTKLMIIMARCHFLDLTIYVVSLPTVCRELTSDRMQFIRDYRVLLTKTLLHQILIHMEFQKFTL